MIGPSTFRSALAVAYRGGTEFSLNEAPTFGSNTQGCFSFWYKPTITIGFDGVGQAVLGYGSRSVSNNVRWDIRHRRDLGIAPMPNNFLSVSYRTVHNGPATEVTFTTTPVLQDQWYYVEIESNGSTITGRINGVTQSKQVVGTDTGRWLGHLQTTGGLRFTLGCLWYTNVFASPDRCVLDEICVYNRPLTAPESTFLYNGGAGNNPLKSTSSAALISWFRGGEDGATALSMPGFLGANTMVHVGAVAYEAP